MRKIYIIWILFCCPFLGLTQSSQYPKRFFQPLSVNGKINFEGGYRYQIGTTNDIYDYRKSPVLNGGVLLNTSSYFFHPNFLMFDLGGEYNPGLERNDYLVVPDRSESRTFKGFNASAGFFRGKPITLGAFVNYIDGYTNREDLANIQTISLNYGGTLSWSSKIALVQLNFDKGKWDENEIGTGRKYKTYHERYQGRITKSFSNRDRNEFTYYHNDDRRQDKNYPETRNISDNFHLNDHFYFDEQKRYYFGSMISGTNQSGTTTFKRLQASETLSFDLPANLEFTGNYGYTNLRYPEQNLVQNNVNAILSHQLFQSLTSSINYEYYHSNQSFYQEVKNKVGFEFKYLKKIPRGHLSLGYSYYKQKLKHESDSYQIQILDEEHTLTDGNIELLDKPDAILSSIVVRDATGTIFYQLYLDYVLIERNAYIEIQRVPGGLIINKSAISVDYIVNQQGTYKFDLNYMTFYSSLSLFDRFVELYFKGSRQDYSNMENTENVTLDYLRQNIFGIKLEYKIASVGVEFENYNSSITPYNEWSCFAQLQGNISNKVGFAILGTLHNYHMLYNDSYQSYADVTGNMTWNTSNQTMLNMELGYRKQVGEGLNLDLITFKTEFIANYRKLSVRAGVELYRRIYLGEQLNYYNVYVKLIRTFDWVKR